MEIPQLRRLPVTWADFEDVEYDIPSELAHYNLNYELDAETLRLLKLGFIQDEIVCYQDEFLYYFDMRGWNHGRFVYKFHIDVANGRYSRITDMWKHPARARQFDEKFNVTVAQQEIDRAIYNIRSREHPLFSTSRFHRKPHDIMTECFTQQVNDYRVDDHDFYRLIWGFLGQSQDHKWMSWFNFDTAEFNIYRGRWHLCQLQFDRINEAYCVIESRTSNEWSHEIRDWRSKIPFYLDLNHYRYEVVSRPS